MAAGKEHKIAVVMGDGIGKEVVPEGMKVLDVAGERFGYRMSWTEFPWSCEHYHKTGVMMPDDGLETLKKYEAVFLGAVGYPGVPDHVSLWGLLVPIRRGFQQYANVRPVKTMEGMESPLRRIEGGKIDILVVRENTEGEYSNVGGRMFGGTEHEFVVQESVFTRRGVRNIMKYAFEEARKRKKHVTSVTKSNGICITMPYWDELFREISKEYPDIRTDQYHIDSLCATLVAHPERFDVIVAQQPVRRHRLRPVPGAGGQPRHRAVGQSESRARVPVHVRAGARLGPGHLREEYREPDRADPHRGHDDRAPGVPGSGPDDREGRGDRGGGKEGPDPGPRRRGIDAADGESRRRTGGDIATVTGHCNFQGA